MFICASQLVTKRSSSPSLSKSPASMPMLASALPLPFTRGAGEQRRVPERAVLLIDPELIGLAVVADVDVEPAIAVEVGRRHAQGRAERPADEGRARDVHERAVAGVAIQPVRLGGITRRRTVVLLSRHGQAVDVALDPVLQVVADEQVQPAVAVDSPRTRPTRPTGRDCRRRPARSRRRRCRCRCCAAAPRRQGRCDTDPRSRRCRSRPPRRPCRRCAERSRSQR